MTDEPIGEFEDEEMRDAIHEAGHAVHALLHGFSFQSVAICHDGPRAGEIHWSSPWDYHTLGWENTADGRLFAERWMVCHLAGMAAETRWGDGFHPWGAQADVTCVEAVSRRIVENPKELHEYRIRLWQMATQFTQDDRNWRGIRALALELVRRKSLSGEDAELVARAAMNDNDES